MISVVPVVFLFRPQDRSVKKVVILFANFKGETTLIFFHTTGYLQHDFSPALFLARVAGPLR